MANQKVYNIVINGIKESISEVDVLLNQLDNLEKRLKNLGKEGIKLDTKGLKDLEKIKIPEISLEGIDAKALKKEMQQLEKDIAKGAKTIDGEYTNTLNGLRAKLRDLKAELGTVDIDLDADTFQDLTDEIKELVRGTYVNPYEDAEDFNSKVDNATIFDGYEKNIFDAGYGKFIFWRIFIEGAITFVISGVLGGARMVYTYTGGLYFAKYVLQNEGMYSLITLLVVPGGLVASLLVPWM